MWHLGAPCRVPSPPPIQVLLVEDDAGDALLVEEHFARCSIPVVPAPRDVARRRDRGPRGRSSTACSSTSPCPTPATSTPCAAVLDAFDAPVVVLTGFSDHDLGVAAVAAGAEDYLAKNEVDAALLERSVRYAIERHRTRDTARQLLATELRREENLRLERGLLPRPLLDDRRTDRDHPLPRRRRQPRDRRRLLRHRRSAPTARVRAVIGDVCGHGPDEAALGVNMRIAWRTLVLADVDDDVGAADARAAPRSSSAARTCS